MEKVHSGICEIGLLQWITWWVWLGNGRWWCWCEEYLSFIELWTSLIARFMGPTWSHLGPTGPSWAPCWPHEICYLGLFSAHMMTWWHGNIFSITGPLWGESPIGQSFNIFYVVSLNSCWASSWVAGHLKCHDVHLKSLTHCGLVTLYSEKNQGQHWVG